MECGLAGDYRMAALNNNISMVYRDTGEFDKAEQALDIAFRIIRGIPECRGELATTYINLGELPGADRTNWKARKALKRPVPDV